MVKDLFHYYKKYNRIPDSTSFECIIEHVRTESELYTAYDQQFKFPYFGYNWDALRDSLCGLDEWMREKQIAIVHKEMPRLNEKDLRIYIRVLYDVCELWKQYPDVLQVNVYFPECYQEKFKRILKDIDSRENGKISLPPNDHPNQWKRWMNFLYKSMFKRFK